MTNREIRSWYIEEVTKIAAMDAKWVSRGDSLAQRAHHAWQVRHDLRIAARSMMREPIEVELLRERDLAQYGHPDGPTFEDLVIVLREKGLSEAQIFEAILTSARRTDAEMNRLADRKPSSKRRKHPSKRRMSRMKKT